MLILTVRLLLSSSSVLVLILEFRLLALQTKKALSQTFRSYLLVKAKDKLLKEL